MEKIATDWKYRACDGKIFETEDICKKYEKMLKIFKENPNSIITVFNQKLEIIEIENIEKIPPFSFLIIHNVDLFIEFIRHFNDDLRCIQYPRTDVLYYNNYNNAYAGKYGPDGFEEYCKKDTQEQIELLKGEIKRIEEKIDFYNKVFSTIGNKGNAK